MTEDTFDEIIESARIGYGLPFAMFICLAVSVPLLALRRLYEFLLS